MKTKTDDVYAAFTDIDDFETLNKIIKKPLRQRMAPNGVPLFREDYAVYVGEHVWVKPNGEMYED